MKAEFSSLLELQKIDSKIDSLNKDLETIKEKARYDELQAGLEKLRAKEELFQKEHNRESQAFDKVNGELDLLNRKIENEQKKLYSGTVSNPKELAAIQKEIESLSNKKDGLETSVLEEMDKVSALDDALTKTKEFIARDYEEAQKAKEVWQQKETEIKAEISTVGASRGEQTKNVDEELLEDYEDIRETKGGIGAGALVKGICEVCNVELPETEVEELRAKDRPDYCTSCGRILIIKE
ncbi:hypothetical protein LCGC14_0526070 [marine sediment metagenome]|uniref:Uncharacterized protein n=1 Tax=marine sediment metagenome TaxID=412755 RepID=A0A0F9V583_9ZZZZ